MVQRRDFCVCGYEGRQDHVVTHKKKCTASPIIKSLREENATLKIKIETLESLLKTSNVTINNQINNNPVINQSIQQNITVYGHEELPKALTQIRDLCRSGNFDECVPRYIEMKHFPDGHGNIRFNSERNQLEVFTKDNKWVRVDKDHELSKLTLLNSQEVIERYGDKPITSFFKNWATRNLNNKESNEFCNVKQRVENVIRDSSMSKKIN